MVSSLPFWVMLVDAALGLLMWGLLGRFVLSVFLAETTRFVLMRGLVRLTDPALRLCRVITPSILIARLHPVYVAWLVFMIRFYLLPFLAGYEVAGFFALPLEALASSLFDQLGQLV